MAKGKFCRTMAHPASRASFISFLRAVAVHVRYIEVTSWLVSADDFSSRVARGANERVSAANE